jgi:RNA polymerase sigma-70 factor, ECF subfamily
MEEYHLIDEAKKGDLGAYRDLIEQYSPVVERFAYQMGIPMHDIQDISQEVFIRVYRFLNQFSHAKFTTWLYKITLNVSRDFARKETKQKKKIEKIQKELYKNSSLPHEKIFREEEDRVLHECIQMLDDKYQLPIILFYFHDKKYEEIAEILSLNLSTVKTRLLRGKGILKKTLTEVEKKEGELNG